MLKKHLLGTVNRQEEIIQELGSKVRVLNGEASSKDKEIKEIKSERDYLFEQMKEISQSVYTMLQVKYPDTATMEEDICEEKRFLMFLHGLCADRNSHATDIPEYFTRY